MGIHASHGVINIHTSRSYYPAAASIWFEIWEVVDPGQTISIFPGKLPKTFDFSGNFTKHRFFQANFRKNSFFQAIYKRFDCPGKIGHLQILLGKLFYFSSKVITFEHTFVHDPLETPTIPLPKIWGSRPPNPGIDASVILILFCFIFDNLKLKSYQPQSFKMLQQNKTDCFGGDSSVQTINCEKCRRY